MSSLLNLKENTIRFQFFRVLRVFRGKGISSSPKCLRGYVSVSQMACGSNMIEAIILIMTHITKAIIAGPM